LLATLNVPAKTVFNRKKKQALIKPIISGTYIDGVSPKGHALSDHMLFGSVVSTILIIVVTAQVIFTKKALI